MSDVEYFCEKFTGVLKFKENMFESLYEEFLDYRTLQQAEFPDSVFEEALVKEDEGNTEYHMNVIWCYIQLLKNPAASKQRFKLLFHVAHLVLIIPH